MAEMVLTNAKVSINSVDLSDHVREVRLSYSAEIQDKTAMGDTSRERIGGLLDWSAQVTFNQDYAANKVDATLFPIVGTSVAISILPVNAAAGATNPNYNGYGVIADYQPIGGAVGDMHIAPVTIQGNGTLTRST